MGLNNLTDNLSIVNYEKAVALNGRHKFQTIEK